MGYLGTWSSVARFKEAEGRDPLAELEPELRELWGAPQSTKTIRWRLHLRVGTISPDRHRD